MEYDPITPDTLFCVFDHLSIKDVCQASLVNRMFHQSSQDSRKTRGLTPSRYRFLRHIWDAWTHEIKKQIKRHSVNSWTKKTKDPERQILLF
jgi:hypothetical protein